MVLEKKLDKTDSRSLLSRVIYRHATRMDLPALEWDGEYAHFRRLYAQAFERARNGRTVLWLADLPDKEIIGQLFVQLNSQRPELANGVSRAYIYSFRVRSAYRGAGVGTGLLRVAEADLVARGFLQVTLNVARENLEARRLYERQGYRVVAPEPGRWHYIDHRGRLREVNEPSWRMEKNY
jgi:ribosomal protein S18 acetylase RimI-like enzyme